MISSKVNISSNTPKNKINPKKKNLLENQGNQGNKKPTKLF